MSTLEDLIKLNKYTPSNPYPNDIISANIEFAKNIEQNVPFGKLSSFTIEQTYLHSNNPLAGNIVNPAIITGQIPGDGLIPIVLDPTSTKIDLQKSDDRAIAASAGGNLGQEEGSNFVNQNSLLPSPAQITDKVLGMFSKSLSVQSMSPRDSNFETRLSLNDLTPDNSSILKDSYNTLYSLTKLSGVKINDLQESFDPIDSNSSDAGQLINDTIYLNNDRAFETNAPADNRFRNYTTQNGLVQLDQDDRASASPIINPDIAPTVDKNGMSFPFYFESLNSFANNPEKFITFQATFHGLREAYHPTWQTKNYFGRTGYVYIYDNTVRDIAFSFIVWTPNRTSINVMKQRINWLARNTYPSYTSLSGSTARIFFEAPVIKFTIGDLFRDLPAIITSLSYDWDMNGENRWELSKDMITPQSVKIDISLTILHDKMMQNAGIATSNATESSDFYEFIKPQNKGIVTDAQQNAAGSDFQKFSSQEINSIV